jgi:GT2 family glycosyltransferase
MAISMTNCGAVVVGRNEGERLRRCLVSVLREGVPCVYVDSCSGDGSADWARTTGVTVIELDRSAPLSAARARNAGFERLLRDHPGLEYVQFVDGDSELCAGWLERGTGSLAAESQVGIVCGHVREQDPEASIYNLMCDLEWQRQPGLISACGGIFLARVTAFGAVRGFRSDVMAAEDDELCLRLRRAGWKILAVDANMVRHDAAIMRFRQWWTRARRAGMAYAQGYALHGSSADQHFRHDCLSIWFWALGLPSASLLLALPTQGLSLAGLLGYPTLGLRVYARGRKRGWSPRAAALYAAFTVLGKYPGLLGMLHFYHRTWWQRRPVGLIEFKGLSD